MSEGWNFGAQELASFMRPKISIPISCVGVSAYLFFSSAWSGLVPVILACVAITVGGYSFNLITDKEEDLANKGRVNEFAKGWSGAVIVAAFYLAGAIAAALVSPMLLIEYAAIALLSIAYSALRLKTRIHFKNIYTAALGGSFFLIGATALSPQIFIYSCIMALVFYNLSLLGDLRDFEGDRKAGITTLPTRLGYGTGKIAVTFTLALLVTSIAIMQAWLFYPFLLLSMVSLAFLWAKDRPKTAHYSLIMTLLALVPLSLFSRM